MLTRVENWIYTINWTTKVLTKHENKEKGFTQKTSQD